MIEAQLMNGFKFTPRHFSGILTRPYYGSVFYVDSVNGSDTLNNGRDPSNAFATIAAAAAATTAAKDDVILALPGHSETITTGVVLSKSRVSVIGLGERNQRPLLTGNLAGDQISITGAGVTFENFRFAAPLTDGQDAQINVAGAGAVLRNLNMLGSVATENIDSFITIASGADDLLIENLRAFNTVVDVPIGIAIEAAVARFEMRNCLIAGQFSTGALTDAAVTATLAHIHHNTFKNTKAATAVVDFSGNSTGVMEHCFVSGRHTTIASNLVEGTGMDFHQVYVVEQPTVNGLLEPGVDAD